MAIGRTNSSGVPKYTHPSYTPKASGLYKVTVDASGHVSAATAVTKADITALGIPAEDTKVTVDSKLSSSSTNPVQNKVINSALADKPSYSDLSNLLSRTGDTMTGDLYISKNNPMFSAKDTASGRNAEVEMLGSGIARFGNADSSSSVKFVDIRLNNESASDADLIKLFKMKSGIDTEYKLYGEHNKPTPADIGALPLSGGTLTGKLTTKSIAPDSAWGGNIGEANKPYDFMYGSALEFHNEEEYYGHVGISSEGSTGATGRTEAVLGNSIAKGYANNAKGVLRIYGEDAYRHTIEGNPTEDRTLTLPNKSGTLATTDDITAAIGNAIAASY